MTAGANAVPARSTALGRGGLENSREIRQRSVALRNLNVASEQPCWVQCIRELSARGSADFGSFQREQANQLVLVSQSRGAGDIEAP